MKKAFILSTVSLILCVYGCSSQDQTDDPGVSNQSSVEVPDHLQNIENLTAYPAAVEPIYNIEFVRETVYGESEEIDVSGHIAVDDQGRLITQGTDKTIQVIDPAGSLLATLGGSGGGPGEFQTFFALMPKVQDNQLIVFDDAQLRFNVYSLESLSFSHTILVDPSRWSHIEALQNYSPQFEDFYFFRQDSTILLEFVISDRQFFDEFSQTQVGLHKYEKENLYYLMDLTGRLSDEPVFRMSEAKMISTVQGKVAMPIAYFLGNTFMTVSDDGHIFSVHTEELLIRVYDPDGNYQRAFYHPFENAVLEDEHTRHNTYYFDLPDTWQAIRTLFVDDENRLWIATITDDEETLEWWVMNSHGELLARFTWPGDRSATPIASSKIGLKLVKDGYLYVHEIIDDVDVWPPGRIVKYRIEMTENETAE